MNLNYNIVKDGKFIFDDPNFRKENVRVSYLKNGVWTEYYEGNLDAPYGYFFFKENNPNTLMRLFLYDYGKDGAETIRIKYNEETTDEIKAEFVHWENGGEAITKVWYNGKEISNPLATYFTVEK